MVNQESARLVEGTSMVLTRQGKTLAIMQVCGGSQSFNAGNQMRVETAEQVSQRVNQKSL